MEKADLYLCADFQLPVVCDDVIYSRISAVMVRYATEDEMKFRRFPARRLQVELADWSGRSFTVADPRLVEPADPEEFARRKETYLKMKEAPHDS